MQNMNDVESILNRIFYLPDNFHGCGSVSENVLKGIYKWCHGMDIKYSIETGSGKTTLLFSHLSKNHLVFSLDQGNSVSSVIKSDLLNNSVVKFVDGPTQITLSKHEFNNKIQLAYLDGPHAYPYPDLEYYYVYRLLEENALLIIDDIQIPSIFNLYSFIKDDDMFELLEVIDTTAFFRRTNSQLFSPLGDGWEYQKYNKKRYPIALNIKLLILKIMPESIKQIVKIFINKFKVILSKK